MWLCRVLVFLLREDGFLEKAKQNIIPSNTRNTHLPLSALSAVEDLKNLKTKYTGKSIDRLNWRANAASDGARPQPPLGHHFHPSAGLARETLLLCHGMTTCPWHDPVPTPRSSLPAQSLLQGGVMVGVTPGSSEPGGMQFFSAPHPIASHQHFICTSLCLPILVS